MKTIRNLILSLILPLALVVPELARAAVTCPICGIPIETTSHRCSPGNVGGGGDQKAVTGVVEAHASVELILNNFGVQAKGSKPHQSGQHHNFHFSVSF